MGYTLDFIYIGCFCCNSSAVIPGSISLEKKLPVDTAFAELLTIFGR